MTGYTQSKTLAEIQAKHPFPWVETTEHTPQGGRIRVYDADGCEVGLFEITAFCVIVSKSIVAGRNKKEEKT